MIYNFFNKPIGNIYSKPSLKSEVSSQILYGEKFKILSRNKDWIKIKTNFDNYKGFIKKSKFIKTHNPTYKVFLVKSIIFQKIKKKFIKTKKKFIFFKHNFMFRK